MGFLLFDFSLYMSHAFIRLHSKGYWNNSIKSTNTSILFGPNLMQIFLQNELPID